LEVRPLTSAGLLILLQFLNPQDITLAEIQIAALQLRTTRSALTWVGVGLRMVGIGGSLFPLMGQTNMVSSLNLPDLLEGSGVELQNKKGPERRGLPHPDGGGHGS